ncbi:SUKH-4 family immunity protein [Streptomyces sp. NBC_00289]|uniref:SUKH-4 family immunity protein n=1 Tax=Streptomyces sp. NBC_00289 TaxID=2975703 RepID=UPI00325683C6
MSTIDTCTAVIALTERDLETYVTHGSAHYWPTDAEPPPHRDLLTFDELRREGLRTMADSTVDPTYFFHDRPDLMDRRPLAPALRTLVRFAAVTDELARLRGQFASYAGRFGAEAAARASRRLLAEFEGSAGGEPTPLWKLAALIRPLSLAANPGPGTDSGLALDLPARLLDQEFGQGGVARFEDVDFPAALTHEPTRRFLRETGLPEDAFLFHLDTDAPLPTLAEHYADQWPTESGPAELPSCAEELIRLGQLDEGNSLVLDGATGAVLNWSEPEATPYPLNTDLSTLACTLWLLHRDENTDAGLAQELTTDTYDQLAATMIHVLSTADRTATTPETDRPDWTDLFQEEAGERH